MLEAQDLVRLLDSLDLPVFATDADSCFAFVNQAACTLLGKTRERLLGTADTVFQVFESTRTESASEQVLLLGGREHVVSVTRSATRNSRRKAPFTTGHLLDVTALRNTELACALTAKRLEMLVRNLPLLLQAHDESGAIVFWNRACERVLGYRAGDVLGQPGVLEHLYPDPDYRRDVLGHFATPGGAEAREVVMRAADGAAHTILWTPVPQALPMPGCTAWQTGVDLTAQKAAETALREAEHRASALFLASPTGMHLYRLDMAGALIFTGANPAADTILHRDHARLAGLPIEQAFPEMAGTEAAERFRRACQFGEAWKTEQFEYRDDQISGAYEVHCFQTEPGACACMFLDLTEHKRLETRLRQQALYDPLTGVANRSLCVERIDTALQRAKRRPDYRHAVILIDLDRFKNINDTLGHTVGDTVLVEVAGRLRTAVRELDTVARMGGDEFVVIMEEFDSYKRPIQAIRRIREALRVPFRIQGLELIVTASIGLSLGQTPAASAEEVLRNTNLAMHRAKAMGRNRVKTFTESLLSQTIRVVRLENEMDRALARGEFFLEFQPIIQLGTERQLFGFEALARWRHPERGLIMPGEFIPIAEDSGKVVELGYWALREGSRILNQWRNRYPHLRDAMISVNLSPQQVPKPDFLPRMREILQETGLPARNLKLEVTETALMQSGASVLNKLEELRDMGVSFSVDDFGTGYSSLAYLTRLPLDHLKIDLSFVRMLEHGKENLEIVRAIIQLATSLRMDVVAEGVETLNQQSILQGLGCEYFQGYLFARPLPEAQAEEFLRRFDKALAPGLPPLP
ncbi:MAG: EAL domain-containing protein [Humidesulfovibrio sp.]|nr:EAL domain-containing protein [Humidesulfovibrio sp.]